MLDLIIPYKQTQDDGYELRYALRALDKFGSGYDKVSIVGLFKYPSWIKPEITMPVPFGDDKNPAKNIMNKVFFFCKVNFVSDDFLFYNDDFFLTKPIDFTNYPNYYCGDLGELIEGRKEKFDAYRIQADNTYEALAMRGKQTLNFDMHCPIIYNKQKFIEVMQQYDWNKSQGYCVKSLYANHLKLPVTYMADNNYTPAYGTLKASVTKGHIFSLHPSGLTDEMKTFLETTYDKPSKWEINY